MSDRRLLHERFEPRLKGRLFAGLAIGAIAGTGLGWLVGFLAFEGRGAAILAVTLGGLIAGAVYGAIVGSFAGLESPRPGSEPSETAHPLADPATEREDEPDRTTDP